jgi:hypothetical protein
MTEMPIGQDNGEEAQGQQEISAPSDTGTSSGINPAWSELLEVVPSQLHSQVTPHLQKWDQNYQTQIQKVHSEYEPWNPILQSGVTPQDVDFALGLMNAVSTNPQEVLAALQEWINGEEGSEYEEQGQYESNPQSPEYGQEFDISQHPKVQQMEQALQTVAQILLDQRSEEQQAAEDEALDQELTSLQEKFKDRGGFDEEYVLGIAMNDPNLSLEQAVEKYFQVQDRILQNQRRPGPPILGSGGASPSSGVDASQLGSKDTKALVAQMLAQAAGQQT